MDCAADILTQFADRPRTDLKPATEQADVLAQVSALFGTDMPEALVELYARTAGGFVEVGEHDVWRVLGPRDILTAAADYGHDFVAHGKLPIADCGEHSMLCYDVASGVYQLYSVIDKIAWEKDPSLAGCLRKALPRAD